MTKEQKEAIKYLEYLRDEYRKSAKERKEKGEPIGYGTLEDLDKLNALEIDLVLDLIQEQEKEIDCLKNHVHYMKCQNCGKEFRAKRSDARFCKKCAITVNNKEWYKNLTDEQKAKRREQSKIAMRKLREGRKNDN